jgi:hypothetical protein
MANISEMLKHPALLAVIPAALGLAGTLYMADKEPEKKTAPEQVLVKPIEVPAKPDPAILEAAAKEKELDIEKTFWATIQPPNDSETNYCAYLDRYPQGHFAALAQEHCSLDTLTDWQENKKKEQAELAEKKQAELEAKAEKEKAALAEKEQAELATKAEKEVLVEKEKTAPVQ